MSVQSGYECIFSLQADIVDENPYSQPTVRGADNALSEYTTRGIALSKIVLEVQALLGQIRQCNATYKGGASVADDRKPGLVRVF